MLQHKNIVKLHDVITSKGCQHLEKNVKTDSLRSTTTAAAAAAAAVVDEKKMEANNNKNNKNNNEKTDKHNGDNNNNKQSDISKICGNLYLVFEYVEHDLGKLYYIIFSCFYSIYSIHH